MKFFAYNPLICLMLIYSSSDNVYVNASSKNHHQTSCHPHPISKHVSKTFNHSIVSVYYPGYNSKFLNVDRIPWSLYDHLHYFVAVPGQNPKDDLKIDTLSNMIQVISAAKAHHTSISLTIGGWTGSQFFSTLVGNHQNRTDLVDSIQRTVQKYGFDGIDLGQ